MINDILKLIFITLLPFLELRASIPAGIIGGNISFFGISISILRMPWLTVFIVCVITNIILGIIIYFMLDKFINFFLRFKIIEIPYKKIVLRTQRKIHPYVEKYGEIGVALFIGVPLPGSGVYTGALGAYVLGLKFKKFIVANIIGVLIAGIIVTIISTGVLQLTT
ncbi:MAG: small multi-drug export protein [Candidatus Nanoarchaeia archaeon]|nr:small multi-drug export protein [Candidatus Nanoarchaeia archaeon]